MGRPRAGPSVPQVESSSRFLEDGELPPGPGNTLLGTVAGAPFYVDNEPYRRWGRPAFLLDLRPGAVEGFSLPLPDAHFVTRQPR